MPLKLPLDLVEDAFLASLFLLFATILHKESSEEARVEERNRLSFIYNLFRIVHPSERLYSDEQLEGMLHVKPKDINKRALLLAKKVKKNLQRSSHGNVKRHSNQQR